MQPKASSLVRAGIDALRGPSGPRSNDALGRLTQGRELALRRLIAGEDGRSVARRLSDAADQFMVATFQAASAPAPVSRCAVVAVGGYGRGELAPGSDLDLLFLQPAQRDPAFSDLVQNVLHQLWGLGLKVGHAARTVEECLTLANSDHTVETNLLEARWVAGDRSLSEELVARFREAITHTDPAQFIAAKLAERDHRHARAGASRYMVEPNIKDGKGGLRDLHTLSWIVQRRYGFDHGRYVAAGVYTEEERRSLERALKFLWTVRCHLHFVTGRAEERLTFDLQPELAERMGFATLAGGDGVERFMSRYFRVAKEVGGLTRILCAKLEADHSKAAPRDVEILGLPARARKAAGADGFVVDSGRLNVESASAFDGPRNLMRLFAYAGRSAVDVHPDALALASRRTKNMPLGWRRDAGAREAFLEIIESGRTVGKTLRLMNETGVLGAFIPEFGRIVARMQYSMYHHYTVDEHTLRAVEALSEIEAGRHNRQHPLASEIASRIINRRALRLAMLLHDTGKHDGDQQIEGEKTARRACARLGLGKGEADLVAWLVRHHLLMSDVAQKRDIGDPRTIAQFADTVRDVERLRLLLLITVADMRAVGPAVWTEWKGQLLRDLFRLTEATLHGGRSNEEAVRRHLSGLAEQAKARLVAVAGHESTPPAGWLDALEDGYWLNNDDGALEWHVRELLAAQGAPLHVAVRISEEQGKTDVLVFAPDRPGLFASLAASLAGAGADIVSARAYTTRAGAALDVFSIQSQDRRAFGIDDAVMLKKLIGKIKHAAREDVALPQAAPVSRRASAFSVEPWVRIDNDMSANATVIEASGRDRLGLLAALAHVCAAAGLSISSAHINTYGERAVDVFYVQDEGGRIADPRRIAMLRGKLDEVLRAAEPAAPTGPRKTPLAVGRASTGR